MEKKTEEKSNRILHVYWLAVLVVFIIWNLMKQQGVNPQILFHMMPECLFRSHFGLYCPGCGGTRAFLALLQGKLLISLWMHPLILYSVILFLWYLLSNTVEWMTGYRWRIGSHYHDWFLYVAVIILVGNCILKNILLLIFHISL